MNENYPLILVFYLDREMMLNREIIRPFAESINQMLIEKQSNAMAFFLPTDGPETIQCINPNTIEKQDMEKINKMVEDIKKNFSVGDTNN